MSEAFGLLLRGLPAHGWDLRVVDIADRSPPRPDATFSLDRAGGVASAAARAASLAGDADLVYLTIAQSRWGFARDALLLTAAALRRATLVVHLHGGNFAAFYQALSGVERWVVRTVLGRVRRIIVLTERMRRDFSMIHDWQSRTVAVGNACDMPPGRARRLREGHLRLIYVSNLVVSKGYQDVVAATGHLAARRPGLQVTLDLAGAPAPGRDFSGPEAQLEALHRQLQALPSSVKATYHGVVHGPEKQRLFDQADVLLLPTYYPNEGQPIAILEALSAGVLPLATDWRGIPDSVPASMTALLVPPRDPLAIADRLIPLLDTPGLYETLSRDALAHAERFRPERHLAAIDDVLRGALL
jgi:glycosyltransferase involved in cell wall biosynthesis